MGENIDCDFKLNFYRRTILTFCFLNIGFTFSFQIHYDHIFRSKNLSYYIQLKMSAKEVDLMVNCLSAGTKHVETSLKCLASNGVYIEVGTNNCLGADGMGNIL